ncbi:MAG: DUF411 domain-containing protein [Hyphomicrobiales bacterium]|nr:DUF411 domain-containing protein [Hyphomicrobiales bacterium]
MTQIKTMMSRRCFARGVALMAVVAAVPAHGGEKLKITIYKSPTCGCCQKWADHLAAAGFATELINRGGITALKTEWGVPETLHSCHTGKIEGYIIEGHVPASAITRLLAERPQAAGLAVPGMPIGSPGMEGGEPEAYDVVLFGKDNQKAFARYRGAEEVR